MNRYLQNVFWAVASIFLFFASSVSAHAAEAKGGNLLLLPFNPPLQEDLRYEVTRTRTSAKGTKVSRSEQILRFEAQEGGYVLTIRHVNFSSAGTSIKLDGPAGNTSIPIEMRALFMPWSFDVDQQGSLLRFRDWPKVRSAMAQLPELMVEQDRPRVHENAIAAGNRVMTPILNLTAEQAANQILKGWPSVLGLGGLELEEGIVMETDSVFPAGWFPMAIPSKVRLSMVRSLDGNGLHYTQTSIPDEAALGAAISKLLARLGEGMPAKQRAEFEKGVGLLRRIRSQERIDADFDSHTGVVENARFERTFTMDALGQVGETIAISRLR